MLFVSFASPASSRQWKATPEAMARDYSFIQDSRPGGELVLIGWFIPEMTARNTPGADVLAEMLHKYVVILAVHGHVDRATGTMSVDDVNSLEAKDQSGNPLAAVAKDDLPPTNIAVLTAMEGFLRQSFGAMGKGLKMFIFDAGSVGSCKQGQLSVPFAGETYTWDTPIPGCTAK
jgi:hypothetical protein